MRDTLNALIGMFAHDFGPLPSQVFFEPLPVFVDQMVKHFSNHRIYDVGAGMGHVAEMLRGANLKCIGIDCATRLRQNSVLITQGETYEYEEHSVVMMCRPCHGIFPQMILEQSIRRNVAAIVYVGLAENVDSDLGRYRKKFKQVKRTVGRDNETLYVWRIHA